MGISRSSRSLKCFMMAFTEHTVFPLFSLTCLIVLDFTEDIALFCVLFCYSVLCVVVIPSVSHVQLFATPWTVTHQALLSSTVFWSLHKFMSTVLVMLSNHLILCCPLLLLPSIKLCV